VGVERGSTSKQEKQQLIYSLNCFKTVENKRCSKESKIVGKSKYVYVSDVRPGDKYSTEKEEKPKLWNFEKLHNV